MSIKGRLEKLEAASEGAHGVAFLWKRADESEESAVARWMEEPPGRGDPRTGSMTLHLISWERET